VKSIPGNKVCTTVALTCKVKGLQPGVKYRFVVDARANGTSGDVSDASNQVQPAFFAGQVGKAITVTKPMPASQGQSVGVFVLGKKVSVGVAAPVVRDSQKKVVRYSIQLWSADGQKVSTQKFSTKAGQTTLATFTASKSGRYRIVIAAGYASGVMKTWNGPVFVVR
jgi:hypothetical protein